MLAEAGPSVLVTVLVILAIVACIVFIVRR
jgi:hypothetical protein